MRKIIIACTVGALGLTSLACEDTEEAIETETAEEANEAERASEKAGQDIEEAVEDTDEAVAEEIKEE